MIDQSTMKAAVEDIKNTDPAVSEAAVVSHDGLVMVTTDSDRDAAETLAAIASEILSKGRLAVEELNLGGLHSQLVLGTNGGVLLRDVNEEMVLICSVGSSVNVGRVAGALNRTASRLQQGF